MTQILAAPAYALEPLTTALGTGGPALTAAARGLAAAAVVSVAIIVAGYRQVLFTAMLPA